MAEQANSLTPFQGCNENPEASGLETLAAGSYHCVSQDDWSSGFGTPSRQPFADNGQPSLLFDPTISPALPFPGTISSGAYVLVPALSNQFPSPPEPSPAATNLDCDLDQWLQPDVLYGRHTEPIDVRTLHILIHAPLQAKE